MLRRCVVLLAVLIGTGASPVFALNTNGLVAHWSFEGSAGDSGPSALTGTLVGDAGFGHGVAAVGHNT